MTSVWLSWDRPRLFGLPSRAQGGDSSVSRGEPFMVERAVRGVSAEGLRGQSDSRFYASLAICFLLVGQEEGTIWEACPLKPELVMGSGGKMSHRR